MHPSNFRREAEALVAEMSIDEKASLCSGSTFWHMQPLPRATPDEPRVMMSDGPHGLRKQLVAGDHLGVHGSVPATCFPTAVTLASSWDTALLAEVGGALGREAAAQGVSVLLGPGVNLKRSPLCGRNFEYFSEDPHLASTLAAAWVRGLQGEGVGASLKHFAANNQETMRMAVDTLVDERTLRELYLGAFEGAVRDARPWTVMSAYNRLRGAYCSEHEWLLADVRPARVDLEVSPAPAHPAPLTGRRTLRISLQVLRGEWGFEGAVVSDWFATNDRVAGVAAGLDLEMPATARHATRAVTPPPTMHRCDTAPAAARLEPRLCVAPLLVCVSSRRAASPQAGMNDAKVAAAARAGRLIGAALDASAVRVASLQLCAHKCRRPPLPPPQLEALLEANHAMARRVAAACAVLLRNEGGLLPLPASGRIAVIGGFGTHARYQGAGSSAINAHRHSTAQHVLSHDGADTQRPVCYAMLC
jgi:beta-glucosidase